MSATERRARGHPAPVTNDRAQSVREGPTNGFRANPTVSVVIPCYRHARYLPEAVESVVAQTFRDWEVIIVDDASPDDTAAVAQRLIERHGDRIRLVAVGENRGVAEARNAGIRDARGEFILPLDADDRLLPTMIAHAMQILAWHPQVSVAYGQYRMFGDRSELVRPSRFDPLLLPETNFVPYCSLYRRELWSDVGGYFTFEPGTGGYEDWDFWLSAIERGHTMRLVEEVLFEYRVHPGGRYALSRANDRALRGCLRERHTSLYSRRRRLFAKLAVARGRPLDLIPAALVRSRGLRRAVRALRRYFGRSSSAR